MAEESKAVVPWGLHPLPKWVYKEMQRRGSEYGQNPIAALEENKPYSGPRTAWVRFFSNGISKLPGAEELDGFVLGGVYDFTESFGFTEDGYQAIGVDSKGKYHRIPTDTSVAQTKSGKLSFSSDFPHRPPPSVESISCEMAGATTGFPNACRKVTVNWKCHSLAQLNYLIPYFLTPRITCLVEWGWNNYDTVSLVDLTDLDWINNMFVDPSYTLDWIEKSKGNYDAGLGFIVDFGFKLNEGGGYDCFTTIINANRLVEGEQMHNNSKTVKKGEDQVPLKSFKEFVEKDLKSIDSDKLSGLRRKMKLGFKIVDEDTGEVVEIKDNIKERVFRIDKTDSSSNKPGLWLRMDLIQDIINSFFKIYMENPKTAVIRDWDIAETKMAGSPFVKAVGNNILVPNEFAPRFLFQDKANASVIVEDATIQNLFKTKAEIITKEYRLDPIKFDNLREAINPKGASFPIYRDEIIKDEDGEEAFVLNSGYWGYLGDLFVNADHFADILKKNDSLLKLLEQLLQSINESLCQICQLKLVPAEYGNSKYSVYDENLAAVSSDKDAARLPRISLGSIENNSIKTVSFDVKISSEMMNQLVFQSANPEKDKDGTIESKTVKANPIESRYSGGDRLYEKGTLDAIVSSDVAPATENKTAEQIKAENAAKKAEQEAADKLKRDEAEALKKKQLERSDKKFEKAIFYKKGSNKELIKYYLFEPEKEFMNYVLSLPDVKSTYLNNAIMPGTTLTLELLGIAGINFLSQFTVDHAPEPYCYRNAVWQISDVKQSVQDKSWTTTVTAQVRPLTVL